MKKIFKTLIIALVAALALTALVACGGGGDDKTGKAKTYTFEAEGIDFTGMSGTAFSGSKSEVGMIMGKNTPEISNAVMNSVSNGYFVAYFNTPNTAMVFNIKSDAAAEDCSLTIRMSSEYKTMKLDNTKLKIEVNGTALVYDEITITGGSVNNGGYTVVFKDFSVSAKFNLLAGDNVIKLIILENTLGVGQGFTTVGPGVDCIKIRSVSTLTWESLWSVNKELAGLE